MGDRLNTLRVFARVARLGSFSAAARDLGLSQPSVSRLIADLERELGGALFVRTTRAVTLTDAGEDYLARIEPALAQLDEADAVVRRGEELRGLLRVGVSSSFGRREVIPRLPSFLDRHPRVRIEIRMNDRHQDLVAEGVDVAFRLGPMPSSSLLARRLGAAPRIAAASPLYLEKRGTPAHPSQLAEHDVILGPGRGPSTGWSFKQGARALSIKVQGRLMTDDNEAAVTAAVAGLGVTITSLFGCRAELARADLVRVLADWEMDPVELHAVFPPSAFPKRAARALADHIATGCGAG